MKKFYALLSRFHLSTPGVARTTWHCIFLQLPCHWDEKSRTYGASFQGPCSSARCHLAKWMNQVSLSLHKSLVQRPGACQEEATKRGSCSGVGGVAQTQCDPHNSACGKYAVQVQATTWARLSPPGQAVLKSQVGHLQPFWVDANVLREVAKSSEKAWARWL